MKESNAQNSPKEISQDPMPERVSSHLWEQITFHANTVPSPSLLKAYPITKSPRKTPAAPPPNPMESRVKKADLDEISLGKWARFEKMVGQTLGESTTKTEILKIFRRFLKANHPDSRGEIASKIDFSLTVRIKNELIACLPA